MASKKRSGKGKGKGGRSISKVKLNNIKGGKLSKGKKTKSKDVVKARKKLIALKKLKNKTKSNGSDNKNQLEGISTEDIVDMIEENDLKYIKESFNKDNFYIVNANKQEDEGSKLRRRKRNMEASKNMFEDQYEEKMAKERDLEKNVKVLLPIKTKKGFEYQTIEEDDEAETELIKHQNGNIDDEQMEIEEDAENEIKEPEILSTAALISRRKEALADYKLRIGILSASFLEDPENRLKNLDNLMVMLEVSNSAIELTVPKIAMISLQLLFRDVLPSYTIKHFNQEGTKLKKDTRMLQNFEGSLLKKYKIYLQKLEKLVSKYIPRNRINSRSSKVSIKLGIAALECMCKMLKSHPYFNYNVNIINFIVPFLNNWCEEIREIISASIRSLFKIDKRGEISYEIVRRINLIVKSKISNDKTGQIYRSVLDVFLSLRIKEVDLEKEQKQEMNPKGKQITFEQRNMLSKKQRKKAKDLVLLEKELLEASAEESKIKKSHYLTEISKLVFTIYFRALKSNNRDEMLSAVLEGLAKFAHIINIEYFQDLLKVLEGLLKDVNIKERQVFLCIATVLSVLDGQGSVLALDPSTFHKYLYKFLMYHIHGKTQSNTGIALRCLHLAAGKKKIPGPRAIAFVKRISTMALQLEHQDALAICLELKHILRANSIAKTLLDSDGSGVCGVYLPEIEDPDNCSAQSSFLWEFTTLLFHYHPWVCDVAMGLVNINKTDPLPQEIAHKNPEDVCRYFENSPEFHPSVENLRSTNQRSKKKRSPLIYKTAYFKNKENFINIDNMENINFY